MTKSFAVACVLFAAPLASAIPVSGGDGRCDVFAGGAGMVNGTVVDHTGSVVQGAQVSVRNVTKGVQRFTTGVTGRKGDFNFHAGVNAGDTIDVVVSWVDSKGTKRSFSGRVTV